MFQSLFGSLLNYLFYYANKNIQVKPLFNLHYLSLLQLRFTRSKIVQFMENLAIITALNHQSSFGKYFVKFKRKKKTVIQQPRSVCIGKNCELCLQYKYSRLWAYILRCVMFKRTCIHSLTSVNTLCNLWQGKIPFARLSQSQRARQKL